MTSVGTDKIKISDYSLDEHIGASPTSSKEATVEAMLTRIIDLVDNPSVEQDKEMLKVLTERSDSLRKLKLNSFLSEQDRNINFLIQKLLNPKGELRAFVKDQIIKEHSLHPAIKEEGKSEVGDKIEEKKASGKSEGAEGAGAGKAKNTIPEIAFGKAKWAKSGVDVGDEPSLPSNIEEILKTKCPIFGTTYENAYTLTLIPASINGSPLTLSSFGQFVKKYFPETKTGFRLIADPILRSLGHVSNGKSRWVLMSKYMIPGSIDKKYTEQHGMIRKIAESSQIAYTVPEALEAVVCILTEFIKSDTRLFSENPEVATLTRCQEYVDGQYVAVGAFKPEGLAVDINVWCRRNIGVAVIRKL
ncbi:MAG: hypothetical protein H0W88_02620 [Parachlamydiaceae bacterium]|nr:hypothetical protein [Parachlamydiaceae bacterium]